MVTYHVTRTAPTVFTDRSDRPINGFRVEVYLVEFDEGHSLNVPSLDEATVKETIEKLIEQRERLAALGG